MMQDLVVFAAKVDWGTVWSTVINSVLVPLFGWFIHEIRAWRSKIDNMDARLRLIEHHLRLRPLKDLITGQVSPKEENAK